MSKNEPDKIGKLIDAINIKELMKESLYEKKLSAPSWPNVDLVIAETIKKLEQTRIELRNKLSKTPPEADVATILRQMEQIYAFILKLEEKP